MKNSFLEYYKEILEKVSFDPQLLKKEYHKAIKVLDTSEVSQFHCWMQEHGLHSSLSLVKQGKTNSLFDKRE